MAGHTSFHSPAAEAWQTEFARMLPELEKLASTQVSPWPLRVLRSSQLDAQRLDAELHTMLQEQFNNIFQLFQPGHVSTLAPELNLLLSFLVYWLSIWRGRATPGSELMNLRYRNERAMEQAAAAAGAGAGQAATPPPWLHGGRSGIEGPGLSQQQKLGYACAFVALPYAWVRLNRHAAQRGWGQQADDAWGTAAWRLLRGVDAAHKLAMLLNLWLFLYEGKYRTLVERLLGARLVYKQANMSRLISFEYLNRQLVWQELSEFLLFLLPLINVAKVKRYVMRLLPRLPIVSGSSSSGDGSSMGLAAVQQYPMAAKGVESSAAGVSHQQQHTPGHCCSSSSSEDRSQQQLLQGEEQGAAGSSSSSRVTAADLLRPVGPCPLCGVAEVLVPFVAYPCRHVFCYYCLRSHCEADQGFQCPVDGVRVDAMQRYVRRVPA